MGNIEKNRVIVDGVRYKRKGFWTRPIILNKIAKMSVNGMSMTAIIEWLNSEYGVGYHISIIPAITNNKLFKERKKYYNVEINKRVGKKIVEMESQEIANVIVKSKDVLRLAIHKMGELLDKVDSIDEQDDKMVRNVVKKYGNYPRIMREMRETIKLLNELEGSGESISIDDIMRRFNRDKNGKIKKGKKV